MQERSRWGLRSLALGVASLAVASVCDSLRGPILPLLAERYGLDYGRAALFLVAGSAASFLYNLLSARWLEAAGERAYLLLAAGLQAGAMAALAAGGGFPRLLVCGMLWGAGYGALGLVANLFVIRGSPGSGLGRSLSGLHAFYGLTACLPAFFVARALDAGLGLRAILLLPAALPVLLALGALALSPASGGAPRREAKPPLAPGALALCVCLAFYVLGEALTSMWLVAYLHGRWGIGLDAASRTLAGFFVALGAARVATAVLARPGVERVLPPLCLVAGGSGLALGLRGHPGGFVATAFCLGPFFPLIVSRISLEYPDSYRGLLSVVYALMTVGLALGHLLIGRWADAYSLQAAFHFPAACLGVSLALLLARGRARSTAAAREDQEPLLAKTSEL